MGIVLLASALPAQAAIPLREQQVLDLIVQELTQRHQVSKQDVEVEWLDTRLSSMVAALPDGTVTIDIADTARLAGKGNVPVHILVNGKKFRTIFPKVAIKVYQQVLVAKAPLQTGAQPLAGDVALERQAVASSYAQPLTSLDSLAGAVAVRPIKPGTVLTSQMFRIPPVVKMGQVVTVTLISGGLTMITSAEAKSNGAVGQMIKVMNLDSKRLFNARVVGPNRVEVKLEE